MLPLWPNGQIQSQQQITVRFSTHPRMVYFPLSTLEARTNPVDPVSEDCLTLDVVVPKSVWDNRNSRAIGGKPSALVYDL